MRLPPLNAVRAFDAVARLGSVRAAADEMAVTPAAVSQQLRVLEAHLGVALTRRAGRGLALTDAGEDWHGNVARHLEAIAQAAERFRPGRQVVQITVMQSLAVRWLLPRLPAFTRAHPEIEVRIDANNALVDLARERIDLGLRYGLGRYPDAQTLRLLDGRLQVLASPALAATLTRRDGRIDWPAARLLHEVGQDRWPDWFRQIGVAVGEQGVDLARGLFFSHTMLAIDAAVEGQGIAMAQRCLVERELLRGALRPLCEESLDTGESFSLVWPRPGTRRLSAAAQAVRAWIAAEAGSAIEAG
jgi:LysR family glycine cleavage system transcriptional activator